MDLLAVHLAMAAHLFLAALEIFARVAADIVRLTVFAIFLSVFIVCRIRRGWQSPKR